MLTRGAYYRSACFSFLIIPLALLTVDSAGGSTFVRNIACEAFAAVAGVDEHVGSTVGGTHYTGIGRQVHVLARGAGYRLALHGLRVVPHFIRTTDPA
jgi:hypothetical protein